MVFSCSMTQRVIIGMASELIGRCPGNFSIPRPSPCDCIQPVIFSIIAMASFYQEQTTTRNCIVFLNVIYISFKQEQVLLAYLIFLDSRRSSYFRHCHQIEALGEKTSLDFDCLPISCDHQGTFVRVGIPDVLDLHQKLSSCNEQTIISPVRRLLIVDHHGQNAGMSYL